MRYRKGLIQGQYQIKLPQYEGPLHLLLDLVERSRLDIREVSLAKVVGQYQQYLESLAELQLDIESGYLVVFAQLLEIKSRLLLPQEVPEVHKEDTERESDLVERLKEFKRFRKVADWLEERENKCLASYPRPVESTLKVPSEIVIVGDVKGLAAAMRRLLRAMKLNEVPPPVEVKRVSISVPERIKQIWSELLRRPRMLWSELLGKKPGRGLIVVTFLALLELARRRKVHLEQKEVGEIEVTLQS